MVGFCCVSLFLLSFSGRLVILCCFGAVQCIHTDDVCMAIVFHLLPSCESATHHCVRLFLLIALCGADVAWCVAAACGSVRTLPFPPHVLMAQFDHSVSAIPSHIYVCIVFAWPQHPHSDFDIGSQRLTATQWLGWLTATQ